MQASETVEELRCPGNPARADSSGLGWRRTYGLMAFVLAALACVLAVSRRGWAESPRVSRAAKHEPIPDDATARRKLPAAAALTFAAVETGIESGAGIWGYVFLTAGRGLAPETAGVAVSAYWATMFAGRVVLGPVAERLGPARVLAVAVAGIPAGAALPAGLGLAIGAVDARVLAPLLLVFGLAMGVLYVFVPRRPGQAAT